MSRRVRAAHEPCQRHGRCANSGMPCAGLTRRGWNAARVAPTLILIHSPFLGPATWHPTARALQSRGRSARVPSLRAVAQSAPPYWPAGLDSIVEAAADDPVILVPHSNAGLFVPAVVDALGDQVRGTVFIDAALPGVGPHSARDFLRHLATADGYLPQWTSWWGDADVAELFPNAYVRAEVESEQPRMPLAYYDHLPPVTDGWAGPACGFLWFGPPYDKEAEQAAGYGWPTKHLPGKHLHMLIEPDAVATAILQIAGDWR
jgi:pimeloyl-ACP methyl ester carboxylesterase